MFTGPRCGVLHASSKLPHECFRRQRPERDGRSDLYTPFDGGIEIWPCRRQRTLHRPVWCDDNYVVRPFWIGQLGGKIGPQWHVCDDNKRRFAIACARSMLLPQGFKSVKYIV